MYRSGRKGPASAMVAKKFSNESCGVENSTGTAAAPSSAAEFPVVFEGFGCGLTWGVALTVGAGVTEGEAVGTGLTLGEGVAPAVGVAAGVVAGVGSGVGSGAWAHPDPAKPKSIIITRIIRLMGAAF